MNNFYQKLQNAALRLRLTAGEKQRMRVALYEAMKQSPRAAPAPSPARAVKSPYVFLPAFNMKWAGACAMLLVLALGSGTAYAAQGALPGSPLYSVKVNVNDAVRVALATTPEAKALANAAVAQERLEEAQELEAQGRLDATTTAELQQNFDEHAALAIALVASSTPAPLAVAENAPLASSTTFSPAEGEVASSSASTAAPSSAASARVLARPFMKATTSTTTASTSPAASTTAATPTASQEGDTIQNITTTLERQRQLFEAIRAQIENRADRGNHDTEDGNYDHNGTASSSHATSNDSSDGHGAGGLQFNAKL